MLRTLSSVTAFPVWLVRCGLVVALCMLVYGALDVWPRRLPSFAPRWIVQLVGIVAMIPPGVYFAYALTEGTFHVFALGDGFREGWMITTFSGALLGPWIALGALFRRSEAFAREQALAFQLRSSELERTALDTRLKLLQAQVEPHFLFNTLANIRSLVRKSGSPEASAMLESLIVYLRAAVPTLNAAQHTIGKEQRTTCAYLELMRMRMPDRLAYTVSIEPDALALGCPPMALLTLVENAIKHGIDPSETGGTVDVRVTLRGELVRIRVCDTGVGLQGGRGGGTGLTNLAERLELAFGDAARLRISANEPHGTLAEIEFPARAGESQ